MFCLYVGVTAQADARTGINKIYSNTSLVVLTDTSHTATDLSGSNDKASERASDLPWIYSARHQGSSFLHAAQRNAEYGLLIEFLPERTQARHYKNLINPDDFLPWFVKHNVHQSRHRLSGWKESNVLFVNTHQTLN